MNISTAAYWDFVKQKRYDFECYDVNNKKRKIQIL